MVLNETSRHRTCLLLLQLVAQDTNNKTARNTIHYQFVKMSYIRAAHDDCILFTEHHDWACSLSSVFGFVSLFLKCRISSNKSGSQIQAGSLIEAGGLRANTLPDW